VVVWVVNKIVGSAVRVREPQPTTTRVRSAEHKQRCRVNWNNQPGRVWETKRQRRSPLFFFFFTNKRNRGVNRITPPGAVKVGTQREQRVMVFNWCGTLTEGVTPTL